MCSSRWRRRREPWRRDVVLLAWTEALAGNLLPNLLVRQSGQARTIQDVMMRHRGDFPEAKFRRYRLRPHVGRPQPYVNMAGGIYCRKDRLAVVAFWRSGLAGYFYLLPMKSDKYLASGYVGGRL